MEYTPIGVGDSRSPTRPPTGPRPTGIPAEVIDGNDVVVVADAVGPGGGARQVGQRPDGDRGPHLPALRSQPHRPGHLPARRGSARNGWSGTRSTSPRPGWPRSAFPPRRRPRPTSGRRRWSPRRSPRPRPRPRLIPAMRSPTYGRTEARHGGPDLSLPGGRGRGHRARAAPRPRRRVPRRGHRRGRRACSRPRRACSRSSGRAGSGTRPISEQAILGLAMGAAMTGMRPVAEIMFSDFFAVLLGLPGQRDTRRCGT